ncbi:MAG: glycosyltransferase [Ferruginibacter sp.]
MLQPDPTITVLMPAYNAEKYIRIAIDSVLNQTYTDFELLIINDGSTDQTEKIIHSYTDGRIRLINQSNQGIAAALNMGLLNARAELIARFDADDICAPERLEMQHAFLATHPDYMLVGADADYIDMYGEYVFTHQMPAHSNEAIQQLYFSKCPFIHSAVLFRKKAVMQSGGYDTHAYAFEDHLLWSKLLRHGKVCNLPQTLISVRLNPESISVDEKWRTKRFLEIKTAALQKNNITEAEGKEIQHILKNQNNRKIKQGSYYSLLGKKYLWNNHQPVKARMNLAKAIRIHPGRMDSYFMMMLSFFPKSFVNWLYQKKINKIQQQ